MRAQHEPACSGEKCCACCHVTLPAIAFPTDRQAPDGLAYFCRTCSRLKAAEHRKRRNVRELRHLDFNNPAGKYGIN